MFKYHIVNASTNSTVRSYFDRKRARKYADRMNANSDDYFTISREYFPDGHVCSSTFSEIFDAYADKMLSQQWN